MTFPLVPLGNLQKGSNASLAGAGLTNLPFIFPEASTIGFARSVRYGLGILTLLATFSLNRRGLMTSRMFRPLHHAYVEVVGHP